MKLSKKKVLGVLSGAGFLMLFPGFLLYHLGVAYGIISAFAEGLFGYSSVVFFAFFVLAFPYMWRRVKKVRYFWVVTILIAYVLGVTSFYYFFFPDENMQLAAVQSFQTVVFWGALLFVGFFLPWQSTWLTRLLVVFVGTLVLYLAFYAVSTGAVMFDARRFLAAEDVASYQGFARSALVIFLFLVAVYSTARARLVLIVAGVFVLFILGARSEFYGFLTAVSMFALLHSLKSFRQLFGFLLGFLIIGIAFWAGFEYWAQSRHFQIMDMKRASSWLARMESQERAVQQIWADPFFGQFGGHVRFGSTGEYAHNILSAWVNYGVLGVSLFLYATIVATFGSGLKIWHEKSVAGYWELAFLFNAVSMILALTAKSVFWPVAAFGWGVYALAIVADREKRVADWKVVANGAGASTSHSCPK